MLSNRRQREKQQDVWIIELPLFILSVAIDLCPIHWFLFSFRFIALNLFFPPLSVSLLHFPRVCLFLKYINLPFSPWLLPLSLDPYTLSSLTTLYFLAFLLHSLFFIFCLTSRASWLPLCLVSLPLRPLEYHSSSFSHLSSMKGTTHGLSHLCLSVFSVHRCLKHFDPGSSYLAWS